MDEHGEARFMREQRGTNLGTLPGLPASCW